MSATVTLATLVLESAIGYPRALYARIGHPVGWAAALIDFLEVRWNRADQSVKRRKLAGVLTLLAAGGAAAGAAGLAACTIRNNLDGAAATLALALVAVPGLAQRSLYGHVRPIAVALENGDLASARTLVGRIVGRDTAILDEAGVARAAVESLAESFNDAVVAPAFWLLIAGLPGLYVYKTVNTADSLVGHRDARFAAFGWAAARADDAMNLVPARIAGLMLCLVAGRGLATMVRDAPGHASPNAGWPEAAMAGALSIRLGGAVSYDGEPHARPWFGTGAGALDAAAIRAALRVYVRACALLWVLVGAFAWAV